MALRSVHGARQSDVCKKKEKRQGLVGCACRAGIVVTTFLGNLSSESVWEP